MFNSDQEDKIRNLLTIVVLYFQLESSCNGAPEKQEMLSTHKKDVHKAINELISVMNVDGSIKLPPKQEVKLKFIPPQKENSLIEKMKEINNSFF